MLISQYMIKSCSCRQLFRSHTTAISKQISMQDKTGIKFDSQSLWLLYIIKPIIWWVFMIALHSFVSILKFINRILGKNCILSGRVGKLSTPNPISASNCLSNDRVTLSLPALNCIGGAYRINNSCFDTDFSI